MLHLIKKKACSCGVIAVALTFLACDREKDGYMAQIDQIPISQPPHFELPKIDSPLDSRGIYKPADQTIYGAVAPIKYQLLSQNDRETRIYVPNMMSLDIERFVQTYFPNQKVTHYAVSGKFEISPELSEDAVNSDGRLPNGDSGEQAAPKLVHITIKWQRDHNRFEWTYENPDYKAPEPDNTKPSKSCATCRMAAAGTTNPQPDAAPAENSDTPQVEYKDDTLVDKEKLPPLKQAIPKEPQEIKLKDPQPVLKKADVPFEPKLLVKEPELTKQKETK